MTPTPVPTVDRTPEPSIDHGHLGEAMAYRLPDATEIQFTDWSAIKASLGRGDVGSASPPDDRQAVIDELTRSQAVASPFALDDLAHHADAWGFDNLDLHWEAVIRTGGPPVHVLQFEGGFDFAPLVQRFDARGFETLEHGGVTIRSRELGGTEDWSSTTDFAILNTALMPDGLTLILSRGLAAVTGVIDHLADPAPDPEPLIGIADVLTGASAATLSLSEDLCLSFDPRSRPPLPTAWAEEVQQRLDDAEPIDRADALGLGYSRAWDPIGRIAFAYEDAGTAETDLPGRRLLAATGLSMATGEPYSETAFGLVDAAAADGVITLQVSPLDDLPRRLFDLYEAADMTFAGC